MEKDYLLTNEISDEYRVTLIYVRKVSITKSLKVFNGIVDEKKAKTESSIRTIKLSESTINLVKEYKKW